MKKHIERASIFFQEADPRTTCKDELIKVDPVITETSFTRYVKKLKIPKEQADKLLLLHYREQQKKR